MSFVVILKKIMERVISKFPIIALIFSCVSLMLATIPSYVIENKLKTLDMQSLDAGKPVTLEFKGLKLNFTKHKKNEKAVENELKIQKLTQLKQKSKIALYTFGVLSIFLGIYSLTQKHSRRISTGSIITAAIALVWQYITTGITIGVAIVIAIFILVNFN